MVYKSDMQLIAGGCFAFSILGMIVYFPIQFIVYYPIMNLEFEKADS
jgi:hypothetical protein